MERDEDLLRFLRDFGGSLQVMDESRDLLHRRALWTARQRANAFRGWRNPGGMALSQACGFARRREMNAVAGRERGTHCIAVFDPLPRAFLDVFSTLLSLPGLLPHIGDAAREDSARISARRSASGIWPRQMKAPTPRHRRQ